MYVHGGVCGAMQHGYVLILGSLYTVFGSIKSLEWDIGWNSGVKNGLEQWMQLTHVTGAVQGCASYYGSSLLPHHRGRTSKFSVATFSSTMVRWSEHGVTRDWTATKVVRPSSDRESRCTDGNEREMTEIKH